MYHIRESLSLGRLCWLFYLCLYYFLPVCVPRRCGHPLYLCARTIQFFLSLLTTKSDMFLLGLEKADISDCSGFLKVTRSKILF